MELLFSRPGACPVMIFSFSITASLLSGEGSRAAFYAALLPCPLIISLTSAKESKS
jgi:hypothetical protein